MKFRSIVYTYLLVVLVAMAVPSKSIAQSCTGISNWSPVTIYNGGNQTVLNGQLYQAKWWTQNESPSNPNAPWVNLGACSGSSFNATSCSGVSAWNSSTAYKCYRIDRSSSAYCTISIRTFFEFWWRIFLHTNNYA